MPIFNHDDGRLRNKLNIELKETYYIIQERKIEKILSVYTKLDSHQLVYK